MAFTALSYAQMSRAFPVAGSVYSYAGRAPIIIVYAATAVGGTLCTDEECLESAEFTPAAIPWDELAFRSTHDGLRDYLAGIRHPIPA